MLLEIDAGNTRLKWRVSEWLHDRVGAVRARGAVSAIESGEALAGLLQALADAGVDTLSRILIASVRPEAFRGGCTAALQERYGVIAEFAVSEASWGGLRNGYAMAERLGVDRWLALIAAWQATAGPFCVVDCGTTITLDVVSADGQHGGGFIVPGLQLMRDTMSARSAALAVPAAEPGVELGITTVEAISNGIHSMVLGYLRDQHRLISRSCGAACWYLTGGDAPMLEHCLDWECRVVPELVLDGLRLALLESGGLG